MKKNAQEEKYLRLTSSLNEPPKTALESKPEASPKAIGRPKTGKSSNPDYKAVTVYIHKSVHKAILRWTLDNDDKRDFSELTEDALISWLARQKTDLSDG